MSNKDLFVERRPQGDHAVRRANSERASTVAPTQPDCNDCMEVEKGQRVATRSSVGRNGSPIYVKASGKPMFDINREFRGLAPRLGRVHGDRVQLQQVIKNL